MANTYTQIYIQTVFAVENRTSLIHKEWKEELHKYITAIIQDNSHKLIAINSVPDHVHIFIGMKPDQSVSNLLKNIKESSSRWINKKGVVRGKFRWQSGFGAFSYAHSQINSVVKYIKNQEEHHKKKTFRQEYSEFLKKYDVPYDERYIFKEII